MIARSPVLAVFGHVGFDEDTRSGVVTRRVGGAAYYAARAAAAAGCPVQLVSAVGRDFPMDSLDGIDSSATRRYAGPSAVFRQSYDTADRVIAFEGQLNACERLSPKQIPLTGELPAAVFLTAAHPQQQARALSWLREIHYRGVVAIDTTLIYIREFESLLENTTVVNWMFLNSDEYAALGKPPPPETGLIVKRGPEGALIREGGLWSEVPTSAASSVVTTTGAGDVLAGTFLAALLRGTSSMEAVSFAVERATRYVQLGPDSWATA